LPLTDERLGYDQQDAPRTLRAGLGNNQAGLNRLSKANLVRKNATAFAKASKRKDYSVNLVGVWINPRLALRSRIALPVIRSAHANEILCKDALIEWVECCHWRSYQ
jgi:hypothetical protein